MLVGVVGVVDASNGKKRAPQEGSPVKPVKASFRLVSIVGVEPFDTINLSNEIWS